MIWFFFLLKNTLMRRVMHDYTQTRTHIDTQVQRFSSMLQRAWLNLEQQNWLP